MKCPYCGNTGTRVIDSRPADGGTSTRRRRLCLSCGNRFTTYERVARTLTVRKRDGSIEPYRPDKILGGIERAVTDRPISAAAVEDLVKRVESLPPPGSTEIVSEDIGRVVLEGLRELDDVAYLRFASVYKEFEGAGDFEREMAALEED